MGVVRKPNEPIRVLSIDFDYFQNVPKKTVMYNYPDGHDFAPTLSAMCWGGHYGNKQFPVEEVTVNKDEIRALKDLIKSQKNVWLGEIALSHISCYDLVMEETENKQNAPIEITNLDMHHDMFNDNPDVDCGNWVSKLVEERPNTRINWVVNPISESLYGLEKDNKVSPHLLHSVNDLKGNQYDYIFLCRSDNWLPPHLDKDFAELSKFMQTFLKCPIRIQKGFEIDRMEVVTECKKQYEETIEKVKILRELNKNKAEKEDIEIEDERDER